MSGVPTIRAERPDDRGAVLGVVERAFGQATEAELVTALDAAGDILYSRVAILEDSVVGHVLFSPVRIEGVGAPAAAVGLAPLAVEPGLQGRGVGSALVRDGLACCAAGRHTLVFLLGSPAYYGRFGFRAASELSFDYPEPGVGPAFQVIELEPNRAAGMAGTVHYSAAFSGL